MTKHKTPLLDQLESGPWPSFVSDLKQQAEVRTKNKEKVEFQIPVDVVEDLLGIMELSYVHGRTHWKHGGIVGVFGYGGGVIGRYCDQPEQFPGVAHFHTMRVNQPSGKFYTAEYLRQGRSPSRKVNELDNRGSTYFLVRYWARALATQGRRLGDPGRWRLEQPTGRFAR